VTRAKWFVLALCIAGFVWPICFLGAIVVYELVIRKGKGVVALWLEGRIHGGGRRHGN